MSTNNLAAILYKKNDIRLEQRLPGEPGDEEVLIRIDSVGICGSDVHQWTHGGIGHKMVKEPMVMGHEAAGVVERCGPKVCKLKPGDRVAIEPAVPCGKCRLCLSGRYNICNNVRCCSAPPYDGALRRRYVHPEAFCHKLPESVSLEEGSLVEPLSVGVHACSRGGVTLGSRVLICGAGTIGLVNLLTAKAMGAATVAMTDIDQARLEFARTLGADHTKLVASGESATEIAEFLINKYFDGEGADVSIECSGAEASLNCALHATCAGGTVVPVGMGPAEVKLPIISACIRKEVDIRGVFRYVNSYPKAIAMLASGIVDAKPLITHRFRLEDTLKAFETAKTGKGGAVKIIIKC